MPVGANVKEPFAIVIEPNAAVSIFLQPETILLPSKKAATRFGFENPLPIPRFAHAFIRDDPGIPVWRDVEPGNIQQSFAVGRSH